MRHESGLCLRIRDSFLAFAGRRGMCAHPHRLFQLVYMGAKRIFYTRTSTSGYLLTVRTDREHGVFCLVHVSMVYEYCCTAAVYIVRAAVKMPQKRYWLQVRKKGGFISETSPQTRSDNYPPTLTAVLTKTWLEYG